MREDRGVTPGVRQAAVTAAAAAWVAHHSKSSANNVSEYCGTSIAPISQRAWPLPSPSSARATSSWSLSRQPRPPTSGWPLSIAALPTSGW